MPWGAALGGGLQGLGQGFEWMLQYQDRQRALKRQDDALELQRLADEERRKDRDEDRKIRAAAEARQAEADRRRMNTEGVKQMYEDRAQMDVQQGQAEYESLIADPHPFDPQWLMRTNRAANKAKITDPPWTQMIAETPEARDKRERAAEDYRAKLARDTHAINESYDAAHPKPGTSKLTPEQIDENKVQNFLTAMELEKDPAERDRMQKRFLMERANIPIGEAAPERKPTPEEFAANVDAMIAAAKTPEEKAYYEQMKRGKPVGVTPPAPRAPTAPPLRQQIKGYTTGGAAVMGDDPDAFPLGAKEYIDSLRNKKYRPEMFATTTDRTGKPVPAKDPEQAALRAALQDLSDTGDALLRDHPALDMNRARNYLEGLYNKPVPRTRGAGGFGPAGGGAAPVAPMPPTAPPPRPVAPVPSHTPAPAVTPSPAVTPTPTATPTAPPSPSPTATSDPRQIQALSMLSTIRMREAMGQDATDLRQQLAALSAAIKAGS